MLINFASYRSAFDSSMAALEEDTIRTVVIIAEGVPESQVYAGLGGRGHREHLPVFCYFAVCSLVLDVFFFFLYFPCPVAGKAADRQVEEGEQGGDRSVDGGRRPGRCFQDWYAAAVHSVVSLIFFLIYLFVCFALLFHTLVLGRRRGGHN